MSKSVCYNDAIRVGQETLFSKQWYKKGITYIIDMINNDGEIYKYDAFIQRYDIKTFFFTYEGMKKAVSSFIHIYNFSVKAVPRPIFPYNISKI